MIEQRIYDSQDLLIGEPTVIPPNHHFTESHRLVEHFRLPTGELPDFILDITAICDEYDNGGTVELVNPVTQEPLKFKVIDVPPLRFSVRNDDGSLGAIEWSHVPEIEREF